MGIVEGFFSHSIDTIQSITKDGRGNEVASTVYSNVPCRWVETTRRILDDNAELVDISIEVWISSNYIVLSSYRVIKSSVQYRIARVLTRYDLSGAIDHVKLYLV
jgi:hypothetical protein